MIGIPKESLICDFNMLDSGLFVEFIFESCRWVFVFLFLLYSGIATAPLAVVCVIRTMLCNLSIALKDVVSSLDYDFLFYSCELEHFLTTPRRTSVRVFGGVM